MIKNAIHRATLRSLNRISSKVVKNVNERPSHLSGKEGDIVHYQNKNNFNKIEQYVKKGNQWIDMSTGRPLKDTQKTKRLIKSKTG